MVLSNLLAMPNYMKLFKCIQGRLVAHSSSTESDTESANEFFSVSHIFFYPATLLHSKHSTLLL